MGPESVTVIQIDHQIVYELWRDPYFWEMVPSWEEDRDLAEFEVNAAEESKSSLSIKHSELYHDWVVELERCFTRDQRKLQEIINYIRFQRYRPEEEIILPPFGSRKTAITLSDGVDS